MNTQCSVTTVLALVAVLTLGSAQLAGQNEVKVAVAHSHGEGSCAGMLSATPLRFTYAYSREMSGRDVAMDHSFSIPQKNIVAYEFFDNGQHDKGLRLTEWKLEDGRPGNNATFIFNNPEDAAVFKKVMDKAHATTK